MSRIGDAATAERGARWITTSAVVVGALNYGYALLLTHLLDVRAYAVFAAGQSLVLGSATVATVALPWMLVQGLARARSARERAEAVRFTVRLAIGAGLAAAAVVSVTASRFAGTPTTMGIALAAFLISVTTVSFGFLQGTERLRTLACAHAGEAVLKVCLGTLLVVGFGWSDAGALLALGIAVLPLFLWWPYGMGRGLAAHGTDEPGPPAGSGLGDLGRRALGIGAVQGLVALVAALDVVLVTVLPTGPADAASYQASAMLGRVPVYLATALSTAFFPALARRRAGPRLAASAIRMYLTVALPVVMVCATAPAAVLDAVFPEEYARMSALLAFTAVTGFAVGVLNLTTSFFQAADDYWCLRPQLLGLAICVASLLIGRRLGGITGFAAGAAIGACVAAALLVARLVRHQGAAVLAWPALAELVLPAVLLAATRSVPWLWLVAAAAVGGRAASRFFLQSGPSDERSTPAGRSRASGPVCPAARSGPGRVGRRVVISTYDDLRSRAYAGGGAVVIGRVAHRLADEGFEVTVVTAARHAGVGTNGGVTYHRLPVGWAGPRAGQLLFGAVLPFVARRVPHDVWLESFTPPFATSLLPLVTRAPVIGVDQLRCGPAMQRKYHLPFAAAERVGYRCYRNLVVLNEADAAEVRRLSPHASVEVIPNGVDMVAGGGPGTAAHILFLGRIDTWEKGLDLLLPAYAEAAVELPLILAGAGTRAEEKRLAELLAACPATGRTGGGGGVRWVGHVDGTRKRDLLRDSAFLVMPSRIETFGLVALEAMSEGTPVLHFDLPALRWMRAGGDVIVPPYDVDLLADRMRRLAADAGWRGRLGRQAVRTAGRYTTEAMTGRYLDLVRRLTAPRAEGRT